MIYWRIDPARPGQHRHDRGPLVLKCDGCGKKATPSLVATQGSGWRSDLGTKAGRPTVLDLCPGCVAALFVDKV